VLDYCLFLNHRLFFVTYLQKCTITKVKSAPQPKGKAKSPHHSHIPSQRAPDTYRKQKKDVSLNVLESYITLFLFFILIYEKKKPRAYRRRRTHHHIASLFSRDKSMSNCGNVELGGRGVCATCRLKPSSTSAPCWRDQVDHDQVWGQSKIAFTTVV
jgi:hypothetical protein